MKLIPLVESNQQPLNELDVDQHFIDRLINRFSKQTYFPVILRVTGQEDKRVGTYWVSNDEAKQVLDSITDMTNFKMQGDDPYGIVIHKFNLLDGKNMIWPSNDLRLQALNDVVRKNGRLYLYDTETKSIGDVLFAILLGNLVKTVFYNRSNTMNPEKHNLKAIVDASQIASLANMKKDPGNVWGQIMRDFNSNKEKSDDNNDTNEQ